MTDESTAEIYTMTPEAATAALAERAKAYSAAPTPPTSASTPAQAAARLSQLTSDPQFRDRLLTGDPSTVSEWHSLNALVAGGDGSPFVLIETVDGITDPNTLTKRNYAAGIDALRERGLPPESEQYLRDLDSGARVDTPSQGDGIAFREARDKLLKDPEVLARYMRGHVPTVRVISGMNRVIALSAEDGRPLSKEGREFLEGWLL